MRSSKAKGFTLVEVLLVIVIVAILTAFLLMSFSAVGAVDANTETAKLMRAMQQLRSGWLAYYSSEHAMLGVPDEDSDLLYDANSDVVETLSARAETSAAELVARYGEVRIISQPSASGNGTEVYMGFEGPWFDGSASLGGKTEEIRQSMQRILASSGYALYGVGPAAYTTGPVVLLRIK